MVLVGAGAGQGKIIAKKLAKADIGKGQSIPSSKVMGPEECLRHADTSTSVEIPLPITMRLDCQGPPVSYSEAATRPHQRETITEDTLWMCDVHMKVVACDKEKVATQPTLDCIKQKEWDKQATQRKEKEHES